MFDNANYSYYICRCNTNYNTLIMNTVKLMAIVEAERLKSKLHKTKLCAMCDISTTYYNKLLTGEANPSFGVVIALLKAFELQIIVGKVY